MKTEKKPNIIKAGRGIKAKIWTNTGEKGTFPSVQIPRVYKNKDDEWQDSYSYGRNDLLHVAFAAIRAFVETEPPKKEEQLSTEELLENLS